MINVCYNLLHDGNLYEKFEQKFTLKLHKIHKQTNIDET